MYTKARRWTKAKKQPTKKAVAAPAPKVKQIKGDKNGKTRTILPKAPKYYPAEDTPKPLNRHKTLKPTKLRASIVPGTVLIVLAGRYRGKRVVFLKQLASGLLLVTGPYKLNGVPLRRVNQSYVIATSTKVDVSKVDVKKFDDNYFKKPKAAAAKKGEDAFFQSEEKKKEIKPERKTDQKAVDASIIAAVKKDKVLRAYLHARFTLTKGQFPHEMKF
uniref:60S ribosomal protein L6 n=1 Tax=Cyanophora paradoxa TaxID=2762 RepID=Q9SMI5_CYAPA|nr:60S ribosomal protein L6 (YL 16 like) [Cyanophora paradoxa]